MNKKIVLFAVMALTLTLGAAGAYACGGGSCKSHHGGGGLEGKFFWKAHVIQENQKELGLSDEKIDSIKKLVTETKKSLIRQNAEIKVLKIDLKEKLHANPIDVQGVNDLIDQKYELKKSKAKSVVDSFAKLKAALSADQYAKLRELFKGGHGKNSK